MTVSDSSMIIFPPFIIRFSTKRELFFKNKPYLCTQKRVKLLTQLVHKLSNITLKLELIKDGIAQVYIYGADGSDGRVAGGVVV